MPIKQTYSKDDFWLKIHMKDHVWEDMDDNLLDQLDKFEKMLNEDIYNRFQLFLKTGQAKVVVIERW